MKIKYSTDARIILATSFPVLREIVLDYAGFHPADNEFMFGQKELDNVFSSPHHFFIIKDIARVGAKLLEFRKNIAELRNDLLTEEQTIIEAVQQLKRKVEEEKIDIKTAKAAEKKFAIQNEKIQDSLQTINQILDTEVKRLLGEFDNIMTKHDQEWRQHREEFTTRLINELEQKKILFSHEKEKIKRQETINELLDEFRD